VNDQIRLGQLFNFKKTSYDSGCLGAFGYGEVVRVKERLLRHKDPNAHRDTSKRGVTAPPTLFTAGGARLSEQTGKFKETVIVGKP
jgi:hypothetical protein